MGLFVHRIACFCEVNFRLCTRGHLKSQRLLKFYFSVQTTISRPTEVISSKEEFIIGVSDPPPSYDQVCGVNETHHVWVKYYRRLNITDRLADNLLKIKACTQIRGYHQTSLLWEIEHTHIQMKILSYTLKYMAINDTAYCKDSVFYWINEAVG